MNDRLLAATLLACAVTPAYADVPGKTSVTVSASTLGLGLELGHSVPLLNITGRLAWNGFAHEYADTVDGNRYEAQIDLNNTTLLLDWRPWGSITHFTAGVVYNGNSISYTAAPAATYSIGSVVYAADEVGRVNGELTAEKLAPYAGLGWNIPVAPRTALSLDLGVMFQGEPQLTLSSEGPLAGDPTFEAELERERRNAQDQLSGLQYYPVVRFGVKRRF